MWMTRPAKQLFAAILLGLVVVASAGAAKYAGDPFALGVGGRGLAMGGAVIAGPYDATAAYWNPAGLNDLRGHNITAMHAETFGSLLNHDFLGYARHRSRDASKITSWGAYLYYLGGGGIKITAVDPGTNRYYVVREESHADILLAGSIAGRLSGKLDFGATAKVIHRDIGTESGKGLTVDFGLRWRWHPRLHLALMITDATSGFIRYSGKTFDQGAHTESIYPTVKPGLLLSHSWRDFTGRMAVSGDVKFENLDEAAQYHAGSFSLDSHWGWEIGWREMVFGRFGFDIGRFTAGGGINLHNVTVDFAWLHDSELDETFRVSASYNWGR
jgi:hypothetical protein